jgi:hypothetical protein
MRGGAPTATAVRTSWSLKTLQEQMIIATAQARFRTWRRGPGEKPLRVRPTRPSLPIMLHALVEVRPIGLTASFGAAIDTRCCIPPAATTRRISNRRVDFLPLRPSVVRRITFRAWRSRRTPVAKCA